MKIAQVLSTPYPPEEGIGYYVHHLTHELQARGHDVTVLTRGGIGKDSDTIEGVDVYRPFFLPIYPIHVDFHGLFIERTLQEVNPDVIHVHTPLTPPIKVNYPTVSTVHTSVAEDAHQLSKITPATIANRLVTEITSKRLIKDQCNHADALSTVANSVQKELETHYGITGVQVVGNGVNLAEFDDLDSKYSLSEGGEYALFVGRLNHRKGIPDLIDAWTKLTPQSRIPLKIVGKGPLRSSLQSQISNSSIEEDIEFLGHVHRDRLIELYKNATLSIVPSHYEGLPTVLLESMAARSPVIATSVSGALDVIDDGENGILVPVGQPDQIANAVTELLEDQELRERLAENARRTIEGQYTWDAITTRYLDIYSEVLET